MKDKDQFKIPLRNVAFMLYHVAKRDIYDPELFEKLEGAYRTIASIDMTSRHAQGGVYGYYRSNQGTKFGLDFWEEQLAKNIDNIRKSLLVSNEMIRHSRNRGVNWWLRFEQDYP